MEAFLMTLAVITVGLMAGVYVAFSVIVMPALKQVDAENGATVMQIINRDIVSSVFMFLFWLSSLLSLFLLVVSQQWIVKGGCALYLVGMLGVTAVFNVPLNKQLEAVTPHTKLMVWRRYLTRWCWWNHCRTVTSAITLIVFAAQ
ncbi:MAG: DUF1772 domain-containing protein [Alteromonadaceae bacterium]|nr:DUF1772 domain-containing protein [Alteromonadaceae bacterium]